VGANRLANKIEIKESFREIGYWNATNVRYSSIAMVDYRVKGTYPWVNAPEPCGKVRGVRWSGETC